MQPRGSAVAQKHVLLTKAFNRSKTSNAELIRICERLIEVLKPDNFLTTENSSYSNSIFSDDTTSRTIESWVAKIAHDFMQMRKGAEARSFKVCEVLDLQIRAFAEDTYNQHIIESLLGRKLTPDDVVRLLWVGDLGVEFTVKFLKVIIVHLVQQGTDQELLFDPSS